MELEQEELTQLTINPIPAASDHKPLESISHLKRFISTTSMLSLPSNLLHGGTGARFSEFYPGTGCHDLKYDCRSAETFVTFIGNLVKIDNNSQQTITALSHVNCILHVANKLSLSEAIQ